MNRRTVADPILERYRLGELPAGTMAGLRARCEADPGLRARLEALGRSDGAILEAYPPAEMARALLDRRGRVTHGPRQRADARPALARGRRPMRMPLWSFPAGAALACLVLLATRIATGPGNVPVTEDPGAYAIRLKGSEAGLAVFRKTRGGAELLPPHSLAKPGDTLQVFYHSRLPAYGMIFSVDGAGGVTLHWPEEGSTAAILQTGDLSPLPHAYRLDRAPRLERFFLITSPGPFAIEGLLARARASYAVHRAVPDSLEGLETGMRQYPYTLRKPDRAGRTP